MLIVLCLGARFRLNLLSGWQARVSSTDFDTRMQVLIAGEPPALPECAEKFSVSLQAMDVLIAGSLELIENLHCAPRADHVATSGGAGRWPALEATKYTAT